MSQRARFFLGAALISLVGMIALSYATQSGAGLSPDSRGYLSAARFILQGKGISNINGNGEVVPLTHFAPLYPILLAGTGVGGDPLDRARWLSVALFGGTIFCGVLLVYRATSRSALAGLIAAILITASFDLVRVFAMVWSEPAFICFMLIGFLLIARYLQSLQRVFLVLGSLAIACAFSTRYSGAALVISTGLIVLLHPNRTIRRRLIDSVIYGVISIAPMVLWILRNLMEADNAADRQAAFHPPNWSDIRVSLITLAGWFVPLEKLAILATLGATVVLVALALVFRNRWNGKRERDGLTATTDAAARQEPRPLVLLLGTFSVVYTLFLLFSVSFVDAHTPLDYRILSPLYIALLLWVVIALQPLARSPHARLVLVIVLCYFFASQASRSAAWARITHKEGIGYGAKSWRHSPTLAFIARLPSDTLLYSNSPDLIDFRVNRFAKPVPKVMNPITRKPEKTYESYLIGLRNDLVARGGYIVWFNIRKSSRWYLVSEEQLKKDLALEQLDKFADGTVYRLRPPASQPSTKPVP